MGGSMPGRRIMEHQHFVRAQASVDARETQAEQYAGGTRSARGVAMTPTASSSIPHRLSTARLDLLGGFNIEINGTAVMLPIHAQRVLAYLAIADRGRPACTRSLLAERLWSDVTSDRSQASLRTALWRIRRADRRLVRAWHDTLKLADEIDVDLHRALDQASRLLSDDPDLLPGDASAFNLSADLLPGWEEDWLLLERERVRQLCVHAVEALAHRLRRRGRFAEAIDAAIRAIAAEPLRESAHVALVRIHLDEGNLAEAHRQYERYATLLWSELRLPPSSAFAARLGRVANVAVPEDGAQHQPRRRERSRVPT